MAKIERINFFDLDIDWICSCGEINDYTSIIEKDEIVECLTCGTKFLMNVELSIKKIENNNTSSQE